MNLKKAKALRKSAACHMANRPAGTLYWKATADKMGVQSQTIEVVPFCLRGYYHHLKRIFS